MKKISLILAGLFCLCISITEVSATNAPEPLRIPGNFNGFAIAYYRTDTNVFYHTCEDDKPNCFILVPDADPKTFRMVIDSGSLAPGIAYFAKDVKHVYAGYSILPLADPKTFTPLDFPYARDARHIYYGSSLLRGANARTFKKLSAFYATDGRKVFYMNKILRGAKARSFAVIAYHNSKSIGVDWGNDGSSVYHEDQMVAGLNPKTLTVFSSALVKDNHAVYCNNHILKDVDPLTFKRLNGFYAKDKNHGYIVVSAWTELDKPCQSFIIKDADPATLKGVIKGEWMYDDLAIDAQHIFSDGEIIVNADLKNFDPDAWYDKLEENGESTMKTGAEDY